jgi:protein-tyrosine-phosphatase
MYKVIFACVHNAGRSQMAGAFFNELADRSKAEAVSAGTEPGDHVHPEVLTVMREVGIDLSKNSTHIGDATSILSSVWARQTAPAARVNGQICGCFCV